MGRIQTTIRLEEELVDDLDEEAEDAGISRSEHIRQILQERRESEILQDRLDTTLERLESREERIRELEEQLAKRSQLESKVEDVALEVRQERESSNAPFFVKWYRWWSERDE